MVANIPPTWGSDKVREFFEKSFGEVVHVGLSLDYRTLIQAVNQTRRLKDQQEKDMQRASSAVVREALSPAAKPEPAVAADRPSSPDAERLAIARRHRQAPPPPPDYRLSAERIRAHCDDHNIILITFVNSNRANYAYTWAAHVIRLQLRGSVQSAAHGER